MLEIEALDPIVEPRWQEFVDRSSTGGIFHHVEWLRLLQQQYGYGLQAWCAVDGDGEIVAGLPFARIQSRLTGRRLVAVPFADVCGPVLQRNGDEDEGLAMVLEAVRREGDNGRLDVEVRAPFEGFTEGGAFYHHELPLPADPEALRSGFSKGVKSGISRARREGVEVRFRRDAEALDRFYSCTPARGAAWGCRPSPSASSRASRGSSNRSSALWRLRAPASGRWRRRCSSSSTASSPTSTGHLTRRI